MRHLFFFFLFIYFRVWGRRTLDWWQRLQVIRNNQWKIKREHVLDHIQSSLYFLLITNEKQPIQPISVSITCRHVDQNGQKYLTARTDLRFYKVHQYPHHHNPSMEVILPAAADGRTAHVTLRNVATDECVVVDLTGGATLQIALRQHQRLIQLLPPPSPGTTPPPKNSSFIFLWLSTKPMTYHTFLLPHSEIHFAGSQMVQPPFFNLSFLAFKINLTAVPRSHGPIGSGMASTAWGARICRCPSMSRKGTTLFTGSSLIDWCTSRVPAQLIPLQRSRLNITLMARLDFLSCEPFSL